MTSPSLPPCLCAGFSFPPLSFLVILLHPSLHPGSHWGLRSHPLGIFLPWDSVISRSLFQFQSHCPPLASQLRNIGRASKASLCSSFFALQPFCWVSFTLNFFFYLFFSKHQNNSVSLTVCPVQLQLHFKSLSSSTSFSFFTSSEVKIFFLSASLWMSLCVFHFSISVCFWVTASHSAQWSNRCARRAPRMAFAPLAGTQKVIYIAWIQSQSKLCSFWL